MPNFTKTLLALLFIFSFGFSFGPKPIDALADKKAAETGEIFIYTIKIEGYFNNPVLSIPEFKNLSVVSSLQSKSYSFYKGKQKTLMTLNFEIFAEKPGVYRIGPATLENENKTYKSRIITIKITGKPLKDKMKIQPYIENSTPL